MRGNRSMFLPCINVLCLSLSLSLPLSEINKHVLGWGLKKKKEIADTFLPTMGRFTAFSDRAAARLDNDISMTQTDWEHGQDLRRFLEGDDTPTHCESPSLEVPFLVWCKGKFMLASTSAFVLALWFLSASFPSSCSKKLHMRIVTLHVRDSGY